MSSLYELSSQYTEALEFLSNPDNEIDAQTIADTMEGIEGNLEEKMLNVGRFIADLEHQAAGIKEVEKRQADRRKALENKADSLREYLKSGMEKTGKTKLNAPDIALNLAKLPPSVLIDDESLIPADFYKVVESKSIDKNAIKQAGGCLGVRIESAGYRVSIK